MSAILPSPTPATPLALVRELYRAFAARDRAALLALLHPDIVWIQNDGFPHGGEHRGATHVLDTVLARFRQEWSAWAVDTTEWFESGPSVIVLGAYRGTHAGTGRAMHAAFAHVYRVEAGRITRFQQFTDTHAVRSALPPCA